MNGDDSQSDVSHSDLMHSSGDELHVVGESRGTSWFAAVLLTVNAGLGASLLAFPQAFDLAGGIPISLTFLVILALISIGSLVILAYCADINTSISYQETVEASCGVRMNMICSLVIAIYSFGCCVTYLIIIGDLWDKVFDFAIRDPTIRAAWYLDRQFIISITSVAIILPMCFPKRIDFLRFASAIGVLGIVYICLLILAEYFTPLPPPGEIRIKPDHWSDVFFVLPAICFGYQCHVSAVPVYACMRGRPNTRLFTVVSALSILIIFLTYVATGVFGYLSFGAHVSADVLLDYPPRVEVVVGLALLAIKTYTTYPIMHLCGQSAAQTILRYFLRLSDARWDRWERLWRYLSACVWFGISLIFALFVPDIGLVIGLLGGIAVLFILVFPGLCLLNVTLRAHRFFLPTRAKLFVATACAYIVFGAFVFGLTTCQAVMQFIRAFTTHPSNFNSIREARYALNNLLHAGHVK